METITIIGTGLIGTSLGMALRNRGHFVIGCDKNNKNLKAAKQLNAIDASSQSIIHSINQSTIVVLATPVNHILDILPQVLDNLPKNAVLIDTGSTKKAICQKVKDHPRRSAFVAAHPMAGSETSGPQAAKPNLFVNKRVVICEPELSSQAALSKAIDLFEEIGLEHIFLLPDEHDSTVALISHVPQLLAFAFGSLPQFEDNGFQNWSRVAATGFDSTTRLALSAPNIWLPILLQNKENSIDILRAMSQKLDLIADYLQEENTDPLIAQMESARKTRIHFDEEQAAFNQHKELNIITR